MFTTLRQGGQGLTLLVRHKDDAATAVLKQCKCDNISAANDALREVHPPAECSKFHRNEVPVRTAQRAASPEWQGSGYCSSTTMATALADR